MKQAFFELKRDWIIIPAPGTIFWGYCGTSCALRSSSTRSSTKSTPCHGVVLRSRIPHYFLGKTQGVQRTTAQKSAAFIFAPRSVYLGGLPCVTRSLCCLRYSGSAPLTRLVAPRSGYHFCLWQKMKPAKASLHAAAKRSFIHCSVAAMCFIRRQPCFIFYKPCQMKHCSADAPQYEAAAAVKLKRLKPLV